MQAGSLHLQPGERLPVTLEALVGARLHGLSPAARRGLAVAASMGQPTLAMVDAVAGDDVLADAEDAQIVDVRDGVVQLRSPAARLRRLRRDGPGDAARAARRDRRAE